MMHIMKVRFIGAWVIMYSATTFWCSFWSKLSSFETSCVVFHVQNNRMLWTDFNAMFTSWANSLRHSYDDFQAVFLILSMFESFIIYTHWNLTRMVQINYHFFALFECFIPFTCPCFWNARFTVVHLHHFQWFGIQENEANSLFS